MIGRVSGMWSLMILGFRAEGREGGMEARTDLEAPSVLVWHACKFSGIWGLRIVEKTPRILSANHPQGLFIVFLGIH